MKTAGLLCFVVFLGYNSIIAQQNNQVAAGAAYLLRTNGYPAVASIRPAPSSQYSYIWDRQAYQFITEYKISNNFSFQQQYRRNTLNFSSRYEPFIGIARSSSYIRSGNTLIGFSQ